MSRREFSAFARSPDRPPGRRPVSKVGLPADASVVLGTGIAVSILLGALLWLLAWYGRESADELITRADRALYAPARKAW